MWTHPPTLHRAIEELLARGDENGPVAGGIDRKPHVATAIAAGWHALPRGGKHAVIDLELAAPSGSLVLYFGHLTRPVLAPLALRATPLPTLARPILRVGIAAALMTLRRLERRG